MPKKKRKNQTRKSSEPPAPKKPPRSSAAGPSHPSFDDEHELELAEIRSLLPPELADVDDDTLRSFMDFVQSQLEDPSGIGDDDDGDDDPLPLSFLDDDEAEEYDVIDLIRQKAPEGYFEALESLSELSPHSDPQGSRVEAERIRQCCPECGDAWLMLAILEHSNEKAKELLMQALKMSGWMLDLAKQEPALRDDMIHTYVMVGLDIAEELWKRGMRTDALEIHAELLRVSPNDECGQGLVYGFRLIEQGWHDELVDLLAMLQDDVASAAGLRLLQALYRFVEEGDSASARKAIMESHSLNRQIADFLLGDRDWDEMEDAEAASTFEEDEEGEAQWVSLVSLAATRSVEGFLRWMRDTLNYSREQVAPSSKPSREQLKVLSEIPQSEDEWILASRTLDGENFYTAIMVCESESVVAIVTDESRPSPSRLWEIFVEAITGPDFGQPARPLRLWVERKGLAKNWEKRCAALGIECLWDPEYCVPDELFEGLHETIQRAANQITISEETMEQVRALPRSDQIWHVGVFHPPIWITDSATPRRSTVALVLDEETELIRLHDLADETPQEDFLVATLLKAMLYPLTSELEPALPAAIKLDADSDLEPIEAIAEELDIELSTVEDSPYLLGAMEQLIKHCSDSSMRESLRDCAEMDDRELGKFFQSVARFYRASLWRSIPGDQLLKVQSDDEDIGTFYAVIMGQMGQHRGIVVCEDRNAIERIVTGRDTAGECELSVLHYCEAHEIAPIDLWECERYHLEVAGEDAFPLLQRSLSEHQFRRPTRSELIDLDIALRVLPAFAERRVVEETVTQTVSTFQGPETVSLTWISPH